MSQGKDRSHTFLIEAGLEEGNAGHLFSPFDMFGIYFYFYLFT
jgi:hypothetical protein